VIHILPAILSVNIVLSFSHVPGLRVVGEEAIRVTSTIDIKSDQLSIIVDAVDSGGANAVGVINGLPLCIAQGAGQLEAMHQAIAVHIGTHDLIRLVDAKGSRIGGVGVIKLRILSVFQQKANYVAIGGRQEAGDVTIVVDARRSCAGSSGRKNFGEFAGCLVQAIGMIDAIGIRVEADRNAAVINAQQLIDGAFASVGVFIRREDAVPLNEAGVDAITVNPEAGCVTFVVDGSDLSLHRAREVLVDIVALTIGWLEGVALVGMTGSAAAEVARNDAVIVDAQQLVEGGISLVIQRGEGIARRHTRRVRVNGYGTGRRCAGEHYNAESGHGYNHYKPTIKRGHHVFVLLFAFVEVTIFHKMFFSRRVSF
jgi:hypothetical protein